MASKKYTLLTGFLCLLFFSAFSQAQKRSYEDSTVIPAKRMPQHTEFLNGTNNFPAKPRNQWEVGIKVGTFTVSGDVPAIFPTPGFGIHVRKALGYVFSLRLEYMYGIGKGLHWRWNENYGKNTPLVAAGYSAPTRTVTGLIVSTAPGNPALKPVYYNYKTNVQDLSLEGIITLNNIRFHKAKTGFNFYGIVGFGGTVYDTKINIRDANNAIYDWSTIPQGAYKDRKDTRKAIKDKLDDSYETDAQNQGDRRPKLFGNTFKPSGTVGAGIAFKLSTRLNLAIEDRISFIKDDLLDGQQWQEHAWGDASLTSDFDSYNYLSVGLNINLGSKAVEPLWWINPLDYAYSEIRNPKLMKIPKPVLPDADGDGVTDQFDQEQTPAGCPVDTHGVSRDTDGDGVPDCKDKELVTPTYCQPVDADGVGKCPVPCPDSTCAGWGGGHKNTCADNLGSLPSISFKPGSNALTDDAKAVLGTVAARLRNSPECKVVVTGYCASDKKQQQLSWDHVNKVITHLVEKEGLSVDRFIFNYGQDGGDCNTVDMRGAGEGEEGPNTVAPPHPNLRKK
jgi:outer membrane protein OmpA-like peptidoglycan-associated protein